MSCPREESFSDMFAALGRRDVQDRIRNEAPDKNHCYLLKRSSFACTELPLSFDTVKEGETCPNNPYVRHADKLLRAERHQQLIALSVDAHRHLSVGGLTENSPRIEVTLAYVYQRWLEERQWQKP